MMIPPCSQLLNVLYQPCTRPCAARARTSAKVQSFNSSPFFQTGCSQFLRLPRSSSDTASKFALVEHNRLPVALGSLAGICFRVLVDAFPGAVGIKPRIGFHGKAQRVTRQFLQQARSHAKGDVLCRPAFAQHAIKNDLDRIRRNAITLDDPHGGVQHTKSLGIDRVAIGFAEHVDGIYRHHCRIARVRAHDQRAAHVFALRFSASCPRFRAPHDKDHSCLKPRPPVCPARQIGGSCCGRHPPRGPRPKTSWLNVLRQGMEIACHFFVIMPPREHEAGHRIRAHEIDQMRHTANTCLFKRRRAACAEIMQAERQNRDAGSSQLLLSAVGNDAAHMVRNRRNGRRVPNPAQQCAVSMKVGSQKKSGSVFFT